jgi:hypothetical protein
MFPWSHFQQLASKLRRQTFEHATKHVGWPFVRCKGTKHLLLKRPDIGGAYEPKKSPRHIHFCCDCMASQAEHGNNVVAEAAENRSHIDWSCDGVDEPFSRDRVVPVYVLHHGDWPVHGLLVCGWAFQVIEKPARHAQDVRSLATECVSNQVL